MRRHCTLLIVLVLVLAPVAAAAEVPTTVVVVRHAEKQSDQGRDPHLTEAGQARARRLDSILAAAPLGGLYTSEFHRTRETLVPLSNRTGIQIQTVPARETIETLTAERLLVDHPGQVVVISSHSNLAPAIVEALTGQSVPEIDESTYDDLFIVTIQPDATAHYLHLKYGQPPS